MKRETFFDSLNDVDDKYVKSAMRRFSAGQGGETSRKIGKAVYVIVSAAALIAVILVIWIPSVIFRDKPIEPAVSDTAAINDTDPGTSAETDPVFETDKPGETDAVTEPDTEPATEPVTTVPEIPADPDEGWEDNAAKKGLDKCVAATSVDYIGNILRDLCNQTRIDESADYCLHVYYGDYEPRRKALASWLFTYIIGKHEQNDAYRDLMYITDLKASDEKLITLLPACAERAQAKAKNYTKDEMSEYFPYTYKLLEKIGFDGYESEPDIASRAKDALIAASELWKTVTLGSYPYGAVSVTKLPDDRFECSENDLYAYFGKYLPLDFVKTYLRSSGSIEIKSGKVTFYPLDYQTRDQYVDYKNKRVISQSGNTAVIGVNVAFISSFNDIYERELTFEVKEDGNGVHITGGTFMDKVMRPTESKVPYADVPEYIIYQAISMYMYYHEGRPEYSYAGGYTSYWQIAEEMNEEVYYSLTRISGTYDGKTVHPENAKRRLGFAFEHGYDYYDDNMKRIRGDFHYHDVLLAMNIIDSSADHFVCSLDFTLTENGVTTPVTYTFECKAVYSERMGYPIYVLAGGTFFDELTKFEGFDDPKAFMQSVFYAMRFPGQDYTVVYMRDPETYGAPQELVDIANKYFGDRAAYQNYLVYNGISDVSYFRDRAAVCFTEDALRRLYDDNEKMFVKIDGKLYINSDIEQFHDYAFIVTDVSRCEKVKENKYEIDMTLIYTAAAPGPPTWDLTAEVQIISGRPVITGGTFLDFIFEKMLAK